MRKFKWILNLINVYCNEGDVLPVIDGGNVIGICTISVDGSHIVGHFDLERELKNQDYVVYLVTAPNGANQNFLLGVQVLPAILQDEAQTELMINATRVGEMKVF